MFHQDFALQLLLKQLHSILFSLTLRSTVHFLPSFLLSINRPLIIAHFVLSFACSSCCRSCCCRRVYFAAISCRSFVSDWVLRFSEDVRSAAKSAFDIFLLEITLCKISRWRKRWRSQLSCWCSWVPSGARLVVRRVLVVSYKNFIPIRKIPLLCRLQSNSPLVD